MRLRRYGIEVMKKKQASKKRDSFKSYLYAFLISSSIFPGTSEIFMNSPMLN